MTVKELMEELSKADPNLRVIVNGYECGFDEVDHVLPIRITPNSKKQKGLYPWEGDFNEIVDSEKNYELALCLPRKS